MSYLAYSSHHPMRMYANPCLCSPSECDVADGADCHLSGGNEDKTAEDLRTPMQGMLEVSACVCGTCHYE